MFYMMSSLTTTRQYSFACSALEKPPTLFCPVDIPFASLCSADCPFARSAMETVSSFRFGLQAFPSLRRVLLYRLSLYSLCPAGYPFTLFYRSSLHSLCSGGRPFTLFRSRGNPFTVLCFERSPLTLLCPVNSLFCSSYTAKENPD